MSITITVNGQTRDFDSAPTGAELLQSFGINAGTVVVELNRGIMPREQFLSHVLSDGDVLELLTIVGGG